MTDRRLPLDVAGIEAEIERVGLELQEYGSFEAAPADLLRQYADLWDEWTWAMAKREGLL